jgi:hypothetical protein
MNLQPEVYVTLFDSLFLPQGLALYHSLLQHGGDFRLWILCIDQQCYRILSALQLTHICLLNLDDLENSYLLSVKSSRTRAEYCWTLTPWSIQWVLEADKLAKRVTYLDADTFFLKPPDSIYREFELSGKSFLITEHGYSPWYDKTATSGRFCVQFVPVTRGRGEIILAWWRDRCLEWCFARFENGMFGDQKYIEDISIIFESHVHVIHGDSRFLAPWNADIFRYSDAILYHFHGFKILGSSTFLLCEGYPIPQPLLNYVYKPYVNLLRSFCLKYAPKGFALKPQSRFNFNQRFKYLFSFFNRLLSFCSRKMSISIYITE